MLNWHEGMSTGVPTLDHHHREMLARFNAFYACMSGGDSDKLVEAGRILDFLQFYAQWHFKLEEEYMDRHQCPAAEENRRSHKEYLTKFGAFYEQWQTGGMDLILANDTFVSLMDWIMNHIQGVDTRLNQSVLKTQGGSEPKFFYLAYPSKKARLSLAFKENTFPGIG